MWPRLHRAVRGLRALSTASAWRVRTLAGDRTGSGSWSRALRHAHLTGGGFDLPGAGPILTGYVIAHGLAGRLRFYPGDFFADPLPPADVLIFGHILHDWSPQEKLTLLRKAHDALPDGGAVIIYDAIIDNDRRASTFGLLMSVNMLIETPADAGYTAADSLARRCRLPRQLRPAARRTRLPWSSASNSAGSRPGACPPGWCGPARG